MLKQMLFGSLVSFATFSVVLTTNIIPVLAQENSEGSIVQDNLDTVEGVRWAGRGWDFSKVIDIRDALVNRVIGRVVIDRHGIDRSRTSWLMQTPFSSPEPGKSVIISLWGSVTNGCFAELIVQVAPSGNLDTTAFIPTQMELGIGDQVLALQPQSGARQRAFYTDYTYTESESRGGRTYSVEKRGRWYSGRHLFEVDSTAANILSNAPNEEVRARVTFENGNSMLVTIGSETVRRWGSAYGFNPYCALPE